MDKYEVLNVIGEGSYGLVMKCRHIPTGQTVAVKKFLETEEDASSRKTAIREIRMLRRLKHENLVTMIEAFRHRKRFYIVFEYVDFSLMDELERNPSGLSERACKERIFQVIRAISYCHKNRIIHRDVKPENVLVSSKGFVKLCDFGFARMLGISREACTEYIATRWYRAPELLVGDRNYGTGVDIWAIGCLFAEMMKGEALFPGNSDIDQLYLIVKMLGKPCQKHQKLISKNTQLRTVFKGRSEIFIGVNKYFHSWPPQAVNFLDKCLKMDPLKRFSAEELLKYNYFVDEDFSKNLIFTLREKNEITFNAPLLQKFKTDIFTSTEKSEEAQYSKVFPEKERWSISLKGDFKKEPFKTN